MSMPAGRLDQFVCELQRAASYGAVLRAAHAEIQASLGYRHAWLWILEREGDAQLRLVDLASANDDGVRQPPAHVPLGGDHLLAEVMSGVPYVVVPDAQGDPRVGQQRAIARGARTIVKVAVRLLDQPLGALGVGTFDDEGSRPPSRAALDHLARMADHIAIAAARLRASDERRRADKLAERAAARLGESLRLETAGRLADAIAGDVDSLLAIVRGHATELGADPHLSPANRAGVEAIRGATAEASVLTRALVSLGRRAPEASPGTDPSAVVNGLAPVLRSVAGQAIDLRFDLSPSAWPVDLERGPLEQVLLALVLNARDALPHGGRISVSTVNAEPDPARAPEIAGAFVALSVHDTGRGLSPETQARLFDPFILPSAPDAARGHGLAAIQAIVSQVGGVVRVTSEPERGARFELWLPRFATRRAVPQRATAEHAPVVLVVEDETFVREVAVRILQRAGFQVLTAESGPEALSIARTWAGTIDILLSDVVMQPMGGRELAERMCLVRPDLNVVFMSGYTTDTVLQDRVLADDVGYLPKPFTPDTLTRKVREALARRVARAH